MKLNENNIQAPFQYKISENTFTLNNISSKLFLSIDSVQIKFMKGENLFCLDIGYAIDGALEDMEFLIDDIKVYPKLLEELKDLRNVEIKDNEIYLIKNNIDFKSIIFFSKNNLNKNFKYNITSYSSTLSSFMFDEMARKLNIVDINFPIKNYYDNTDYKVNDIIKYNGYLYRVIKKFKSDNTDYYLKSNCHLITAFRKLELNNNYKINDLVEYENNFFIVQKDFIYENINNVLTKINNFIKPLQEIIEWNDNIKNVYKNQIILKDDFLYLVLETSINYSFEELKKLKKIDYLNKASNTFYDDDNSVQNVIDKLKTSKQNNLIVGKNIEINDNEISVSGGINKEYIENQIYFTNDLIIHNNKLYKSNENFTSTSFNIDFNKLTLLINGDINENIDANCIIYDNSKTNLENNNSITNVQEAIESLNTKINDKVEKITDDGEEYLIPYKTYNGESVYGITQIFNYPTSANTSVTYKIKNVENVEKIIFAELHITNSNNKCSYYKGSFRNNKTITDDKLYYWINETGLIVISGSVNSNRKLVLTLEYIKKDN